MSSSKLYAPRNIEQAFDDALHEQDFYTIEKLLDEDELIIDSETLKKANDEFYEYDVKLIETTNKLNKSLKQQIFYLDKSTKYVKQNTMLLKELFFLKNRYLFQRIFNVQYKK